VIVEQWPIERLQEHPRNYREHPDDQVRDIVASIERFGWRQPIVARPSDGLVLVGHGRLLAAVELGALLVPVTPYECDDDEADAFVVAENESHKGGADNQVRLAELLERVRERTNLEGLSVTNERLEGLLERLRAQRAVQAPAPVVTSTSSEPATTATPAAAAPDPEPQAAAKPRPSYSHPGQEYSLGPHRLVCGDHVDAEVVRYVDQMRRQWTRWAKRRGIDAGTGALGV
jgi:ParB-like chromosome segregation protein Spo0J